MAEEKDKAKGFFAEFGALVKKHFGEAVKKFAQVKTKDGSMIEYEGEMPMEGMPVMVITPDGQKAPAPDGIITLEDGTQIEVVAGNIVAVKPAMPEPEPQTPPNPPAAMADDKITSAAEVKKLVESTIREHYYSKEDVEKLVAEKTKEANDAITAFKKENETLTKELADAKAERAQVLEKFKSFEAFQAEVKKLLEEPQEPVEKKETEFRTEKKDVPPQDRKAWQKRYNIN